MYRPGDLVATASGRVGTVKLRQYKGPDQPQYYTVQFADDKHVSIEMVYEESELTLVSRAGSAPDDAVSQGGKKFDETKPDMSMISRELLEAVAQVRMFGAQKYERDNWRLGFKYSRSIAAAMRHIAAFNAGEDLDTESGLSHIAHAVCCLEHLLHDKLYRPENDDRWKP
jgi:hypothetical protein